MNGKHYSRTLEDWLQRQDRQRKQVLAIMKVQPYYCQLDVLMLILVCVKCVICISILSRECSHVPKRFLKSCEDSSMHV